MRIFWFGTSSIILALVFWGIFYRDKLIKQIPMAKVIVYLGVGIITYLGLYEKLDTKESLATAVVISAIFEIVTNAQECLNNLKAEKKEKGKKETKAKGINKRMCVCICAVITIFIPMCVYFLTTIPLLPAGGNNDWAGFWGGYIGAIIGGIITLLVLYYTLKDGKENLSKTLEFEKKKAQEEAIRKFNDELLNYLVEYHTLIQEIFEENNKSAIFKDFEYKVFRCTELEKLIRIKLNSKRNETEYRYVGELLKSVETVKTGLNNLIELKSQDIFGGDKLEINKKEKEVSTNIKKLIDDTEKYYDDNKC